jgi:hypothetical protein
MRRWSDALRAIQGIVLATTLTACASAPPPMNSPEIVRITPPEHVRGIEQTFLTYPEWFLVFSPAEYAQFRHEAGRPSDFPFLGHIGQFWRGYRAVYAETRANAYPPNTGYHVMIMVIGTSTTVEYLVRAGYENTLGRLAEVISGYDTDEDHYAAQVAQDYVDFIRVLPWYRYDFAGKLTGLWREVPMRGPGMVRKWERRFALSTEYLVKALYGQLIKWATGSVYDAPLLVTALVLHPAPTAALPDLTVLRELEGGAALVTVPRYDAFTAYAQALAEQGVDFAEIAGNDTLLLVSLVNASDWHPSTGIERVLFEQPILTQPGRKRVVATVRVQELAAALREWSRAGVRVEHLFDY